MGICLNTYNSSNCRESIVVDNSKGCNNQDQSNTQTKDPSEISELFFHRVSTFKIKQGQLIIKSKKKNLMIAILKKQ